MKIYYLINLLIFKIVFNCFAINRNIYFIYIIVCLSKINLKMDEIVFE